MWIRRLAYLLILSSYVYIQSLHPLINRFVIRILPYNKSLFTSKFVSISYNLIIWYYRYYYICLISNSAYKLLLSLRSNRLKTSFAVLCAFYMYYEIYSHIIKLIYRESDFLLDQWFSSFPENGKICSCLSSFLVPYTNVCIKTRQIYHDFWELTSLVKHSRRLLCIVMVSTCNKGTNCVI